jgi:biotin carboxyl carrier protein
MALSTATLASTTSTNNARTQDCLTHHPIVSMATLYLLALFSTALMSIPLMASNLTASTTELASIDPANTTTELQLPTDSRVPGGLAILPLPQNTQTPWHFQDKRVLTLNRQHKQWAIVALPLSIKPGLHKLCQLDQPDLKSQASCVSFKVFPKKFQEQHIRLQSNRRVDLSQADLKRHQGEKKQSQQAFNHLSEQPPMTGFLWPAKGPISSEFGLKRFFNGKARSPHTGLDIAAPRGAEVQAPAAGKVLLTGDFFFNGKVIYLNHGDALVSMFCHLDSINVTQGDEVNAGDLLGKVGATGRATGPHLHWTLSLRNVRIDPRLWLKDTRAPISKAATP